MRIALRYGLLLLCCFLPAAQAVDGVFEINTACVNFGCFPGDSGGFPVSITQSGSYRLTSNLNTTNASVDMIDINANNVTLDLNGFEISGPVTCTGSPVSSCSGTGSGFGIDVNGDQVTIENGSIRGTGDACISATLGNDNSRFRDLTLTECGGAGIVAASGRIDRIVVSRSEQAGINSLIGTIYVSNSAFYANGDWGQIGGFCASNVYQNNAQSAQAACTDLGINLCNGSTC